MHAGDTLARLQKARSRLELKLGRPATLAELAAEVEMPEDKVTEALRFAAEPLSLSEPLREDGDAELGDVVEDRSAESPFEVAATALLPEEIQPPARPARRARARDPQAALRPRPGRAPHPRGGGRALQPHPGAHPPDRGPRHVASCATRAATPAPATSSPSSLSSLRRPDLRGNHAPCPARRRPGGALAAPAGPAGVRGEAHGNDPANDVPYDRGDITSFKAINGAGTVDLRVRTQLGGNPENVWPNTATRIRWRLDTGPSSGPEYYADIVIATGEDTVMFGKVRRLSDNHITCQAQHHVDGNNLVTAIANQYRFQFLRGCIGAPITLRARATFIWDNGAAGGPTNIDYAPNAGPTAPITSG